MSAELSPMQKRYLDKKKTIQPQTLLAVRLGDFYELFMKDAEIAAPILGVALTKRTGQPMCGFPIHAQHQYLQALATAGYEILLCPKL